MKKGLSKRGFLGLLIGTGFAVPMATQAVEAKAEASLRHGYTYLKDRAFLSARPKKKGGCVVHHRNCQPVLLQEHKPSEGHAVNATTLAIWDLCDGTHTVRDMVQVMASAYDVPLKRCQEDVCVTVSVLHSLGYLTL